jgi:hypothetical protein
MTKNKTKSRARKAKEPKKARPGKDLNPSNSRRRTASSPTTGITYRFLTFRSRRRNGNRFFLDDKPKPSSQLPTLLEGQVVVHKSFFQKRKGGLKQYHTRMNCYGSTDSQTLSTLEEITNHFPGRNISECDKCYKERAALLLPATEGQYIVRFKVKPKEAVSMHNKCSSLDDTFELEEPGWDLLDEWMESPGMM